MAPASLLLAVALASAPVAGHDLELTVNPETRSLRAVDRIQLGGAAPRFELHRDLSIAQVEADGHDATLRLRLSGPGRAPHLLAWTLDGLSPATLVVRYGGRIGDPVRATRRLGSEPEPELRIAAESFCLPAAAGWYPRLGQATADFRLALELPEGWSAVTTGNTVAGDARRATFTASQSATFDVIAGRYVVRNQTIGALPVSVRTFSSHQSQAPALLQQAAAAIASLTARLGPYPLPTLDLVECDCAAGLALPAAAVLGSDTVAAADRSPDDDQIEAAVARRWWGGSVRVPAGGADWSDGLVAYLSGHGAAERRGAEAARAWRRQALERLTVLGGRTDIALARYHGRRTPAAGTVGSDRGAMVFHLLRRQLGDQAFFQALTDLASTRAGREATWHDFRAAFAARATPGTDLSAFFAQWIDRPELPQVSLVSAEADGDQLALTLAQDTAPPFRLAVPIAIEGPTGRSPATVTLHRDRGRSVLASSGQPGRVLLDPDFELLRRLSPAELPPSFERTLTSGSPVCVYPATGANSVRWRGFAEDLARSRGGRALADNDLRGPYGNRPLVLLGGPAENQVTRELFVPGPDLLLTPDGLQLGDQTFRDPRTLLVESLDRGGGLAELTVVIALSSAALDDLPAVLAHPWDTRVVLVGGRTVLTRTTPSPAALAVTSAPLASAPSGPPTAPAASPSGAAPPAHQEVAQRFASLGLATVPSLAGDGRLAGYSFEILDLAPESALTLAGDGRQETVEMRPVDISDAGDFTFDRVHFVGGGLKAEDFPAKSRGGLALAAMAPSANAEQEAAEILRRAALARRAGVAALLLAASGEPDPDWSALASYPSRPSRAARQAGAAAAEQDLAARLARPPLEPAGLLLAVVGDGLLARLAGRERAASLLAAARPEAIDAAGRLRIGFRRSRGEGQNVLGTIAGSDPVLSRQWLVLAAARQDRAAFERMLQLTGRLADPRRKPARSLLVVALDGTDGGRLAARELAAAMPRLPGPVVGAVVVTSQSPPGNSGLAWEAGDTNLRAALADALAGETVSLEGGSLPATVTAALGHAGLPTVALAPADRGGAELAAAAVTVLARAALPAPTPAPLPSPPAATSAAPPGGHGHGPQAPAGPSREPAPGDDLRDRREVHLKNVRQLTFGGENAEAYWGPDGKSLILQSTHPPYGCDQIFIMSVDEPRMRLASTGLGRTTCAYFMPSGLRIVYSSTHHLDPACPPKPDHSRGYVWPLYDYDVFSARPDGTGLVRLTDFEGYDAEATVSNDGSRIVFTSTRDGDLDLYTMAPDGSDVRRVTIEPGYDGGAFFSPDDTRLVYRARHPSDPAELARFRALLAEKLVEPKALEIMVVDVDGRNPRQVTSNGAANFAPYWHPDGRRILFSSNMKSPRSRNFDLFLVSEDGTGLEQVTFDNTFDGFPMFSPDGKRLVFASNRNSEIPTDTNIFVADWVD